MLTECSRITLDLEKMLNNLKCRTTNCSLHLFSTPVFMKSVQNTAGSGLKPKIFIES